MSQVFSSTGQLMSHVQAYGPSTGTGAWVLQIKITSPTEAIVNDWCFFIDSRFSTLFIHRHEAEEVLSDLLREEDTTYSAHEDFRHYRIVQLKHPSH